MNKKGAELPMNTLIAAIIAIVVLLLIITFFTGGLGTIGEKIRDIFGKSTSGYDIAVATNFCQEYCSAAKNLDKSQVPTSAYCKQTFEVTKVGEKGTEPKTCLQLVPGCISCSTPT